MERFEYRVWDLPTAPAEPDPGEYRRTLEDFLNGWGAAGWEAVAVRDHPGQTSAAMVILKRIVLEQMTDTEATDPSEDSE